MDKTALKIINMADEQSDFAYWQSQPYTARLAALEAIRTEYNTWKYDSKQGFQRVYRITQLQSGVDFEECYSSKISLAIDGLTVNFIDVENFKKNKQAVGRFQDLADLESLK